MAIEIECPICRFRRGGDDNIVGSAIACAKCKTRFTAKAAKPPADPTAESHSALSKAWHWAKIAATAVAVAVTFGGLLSLVTLDPRTMQMRPVFGGEPVADRAAPLPPKLAARPQPERPPLAAPRMRPRAVARPDIVEPDNADPTADIVTDAADRTESVETTLEPEPVAMAGNPFAPRPHAATRESPIGADEPEPAPSSPFALRTPATSAAAVSKPSQSPFVARSDRIEPSSEEPRAADAMPAATANPFARRGAGGRANVDGTQPTEDLPTSGERQAAFRKLIVRQTPVAYSDRDARRALSRSNGSLARIDGVSQLRRLQPVYVKGDEWHLALVLRVDGDEATVQRWIDFDEPPKTFQAGEILAHRQDE